MKQEKQEEKDSVKCSTLQCHAKFLIPNSQFHLLRRSSHIIIEVMILDTWGTLGKGPDCIGKSNSSKIQLSLR